LVATTLIIEAITIPFGLITAIIVIHRNPRNIANILIGITALLAGVISELFAVLMHLFYTSNLALAITFGKLSLLSIFWMTIPTISFSLFFWKVKLQGINKYMHIFSVIPSVLLSIWLFVEKNSIGISQISFGLKIVVQPAFGITAIVLMLMVFIVFVMELLIMTKQTEYFPELHNRMLIFTIGFSIGIIGSFISLILVDYIFTEAIPIASFFVIFTSLCTTLAFALTISESDTKIWHGCPKLMRINGSYCCLNSDTVDPQEVKLIDLGNIIERIQIDKDVLKTEANNCTNTVFSNENGIVCCLTNHKPIKIIGEKVTQEEMELAKEMELLDQQEPCSECLHKIIAYRKEHKTKSILEIKQQFQGIRAEDFFGCSSH
jgi:hypothetical protein